VPSLELLSESEGVADQVAEVASAPELPEDDSDLPSPDPAADAVSGPAPAGFQTPPPIFPEAAPAEDAEPVGEGAVAEAAPPELSEPETLASDPTGDEAPQPAPAAPALEPEPVCYSIGPFR